MSIQNLYSTGVKTWQTIKSIITNQITTNGNNLLIERPIAYNIDDNTLDTDFRFNNVGTGIPVNWDNINVSNPGYNVSYLPFVSGGFINFANIGNDGVFSISFRLTNEDTINFGGAGSTFSIIFFNPNTFKTYNEYATTRQIIFNPGDFNPSGTIIEKFTSSDLLLISGSFSTNVGPNIDITGVLLITRLY